MTGQLVSDAGLARIYAPQPGVVLHQQVSEGEEVKAGEVMERSLTRIIVAHRPDTISSAERVIRLKDGKMVSDSVNHAEIGLSPVLVG